MQTPSRNHVYGLDMSKAKLLTDFQSCFLIIDNTLVKNKDVKIIGIQSLHILTNIWTDNIGDKLQ